MTGAVTRSQTFERLVAKKPCVSAAAAQTTFSEGPEVKERSEGDMKVKIERCDTSISAQSQTATTTTSIRQLSSHKASKVPAASMKKTRLSAKDLKKSCSASGEAPGSQLQTRRRPDLVSGVT